MTTEEYLEIIERNARQQMELVQQYREEKRKEEMKKKNQEASNIVDEMMNDAQKAISDIFGDSFR